MTGLIEYKGTLMLTSDCLWGSRVGDLATTDKIIICTVM